MSDPGNCEGLVNGAAVLDEAAVDGAVDGAVEVDEAAVDEAEVDEGVDGAVDGAAVGETHWVRWHRAYEDPDSALSLRLRLVQDGVREVLDHHPPGPIRIVSICAGQGRDVIDVVADHPRRADVRARLVELDPELVAFARARAAASGVGDVVEVVEGDASLAGSYAGILPADLVVICGVFGNISDDDIRAVARRMPAFCAPRGTVVWTRHRRPPDLTPSVRGWFAEAGFAEKSFVAPSPYVLGVGCHQWLGGADAGTLDPGLRLFHFIGDGSRPA
jgi:SAM-dependent methyltransferase